MPNQCERPIRPGAGVKVDRQPLPPIRTKLREGTYVVDSKAQGEVRRALEDPETPKKDIEDVLNDPANKGFRNAFTNLALSSIWKPYIEYVTGPKAGVFEIEFDGTRSYLGSVSSKDIKGMSSRQIAEAIASSNQDVPTHFVCEKFSEGKVPVISGDEKKDGTYFDAFREQADLMMRGEDFFKTIPSEYDSPSIFIASNVRTLRANVFSLPNLIDDVSEIEGIKLSPDQHRDSVLTSLRKSIEPYFKPTRQLFRSIDRQLVDPETKEFNPESWTGSWIDNGDHKSYIVFPNPDIVQQENEAAAKEVLPVQTNCPAFHSLVTTPEHPDRAVAFPSHLSTMLLEQLDTWYYPQREKEWSTRPTDVFVAQPPSYVQSLKDTCQVM